MKKRILGVAFGAAILFACSFTSMDKAEAQEISNLGPKITCPKGKIYICYTVTNPDGPSTSKWKGKGEVVIED